MTYPKPVLSFHPQATLYFDEAGRIRDDAHQMFSDVLEYCAGGNIDTANESVRETIRQTGLVNLWFFLKVIAAYNGPYEKLTAHLHMDMCNFYQSQMVPGARAAAFVCRSVYKSTIFTYGSNTWEITRDPNIEITIGSIIADRAKEFLSFSQVTVADNEMYAWLWPQNVPANTKTQPGWNNDELTLPSKSRNRNKPNIDVIGAGGSTAGKHSDVLKMDDIVGDAQLDAARNATADMIRIGGWLRSSVETLVKEPMVSRVFVSATRYAADDPYESIMTNLKSCHGYWDELPDEYAPVPNGIWDVYYRMAEENGEAIFPEVLPLSTLDRFRRTDYWLFNTQYQNNPYAKENSEFGEFRINECELRYEQARGLVVLAHNGPVTEELSLLDMDVVAALDPGASEKRIGARTSRSAFVVYATDYKRRRFVLHLRAGYKRITEVAKWVIDAHKLFGRYLRAVYYEAQGPFKILGDIFRSEMQKADVAIPLRAVSAKGDKIQRAKFALTPVFVQGRLYCVQSAKAELDEVRKTFPNSKKMDLPDALTIAETNITTVAKPESEYDQDELDDLEFSSALGSTKSNVTGY